MATALKSPRLVALERTFQAAFKALDEHKSPLEQAQLYETIVRHVRNAQPMALAVAADVEPVREATLALGDGARIDVTADDSKLTLYVVEASERDAAVTLTESQAEQLRGDLARVMAAVGGGK